MRCVEKQTCNQTKMHHARNKGAAHISKTGNVTAACAHPAAFQDSLEHGYKSAWQNSLVKFDERHALSLAWYTAILVYNV
jgi:hypothetical protein